MSTLRPRRRDCNHNAQLNRTWPRFRCVECSFNTIEVDDEGICHYYMVNNDVWAAAGQPDGMLCLFCLQNRLERKLHRHDFMSIEMNSPIIRDIPMLRPEIMRFI